MKKSIFSFAFFLVSLSGFSQSETILFHSYERHISNVQIDLDSVEVKKALNVPCRIDEDSITIYSFVCGETVVYSIISKKEVDAKDMTIYTCLLDDKEYEISLPRDRAFLLIESGREVIQYYGRSDEEVK